MLLRIPAEIADNTFSPIILGLADSEAGMIAVKYMVTQGIHMHLSE